MTPREVNPADISEEVEAEVSTALNKMVADERRFSTPDPRTETLKNALREIVEIGPFATSEGSISMMELVDCMLKANSIARKALEDDDALLL